MLFPVSVLC